MSSALLAPVAPKLVALLASDRDGEVLATVAAMRRTLATVDADFNDLAGLLTAATTTAARDADELERWRQAIKFLLDHVDELSDREREFVVDIAPRLALGRPLTAKQADWLAALYARILNAERAAA
jgi:hypothetical protein